MLQSVTDVISKIPADGDLVLEFIQKSLYSFLVPPSSGAFKVFRFLTTAAIDPAVFWFIDAHWTLIFRLNFS